MVSKDILEVDDEEADDTLEGEGGDSILGESIDGEDNKMDIEQDEKEMVKKGDAGVFGERAVDEGMDGIGKFANFLDLEKDTEDKGTELMKGVDLGHSPELALYEKMVVNGGFSPLANITGEELLTLAQPAEVIGTEEPGAEMVENG